MHAVCVVVYVCVFMSACVCSGFFFSESDMPFIIIINNYCIFFLAFVCSGFFFSESDMSYPGRILYYISLSRIGLSSNIYIYIHIYILIYILLYIYTLK